MVLRARIDSPQSLGRAIEQARLLRGLTQRDVATELGTTQKYVWSLEEGKSTVAIERLFDVAALLGIALTAEIAEQEDRRS